MKRNWSQEDLAKKLNERKSVIAKLESKTMYPDDNLTKKLERTLGIKLIEAAEAVQVDSKANSRGMTLGDYIRRAK